MAVLKAFLTKHKETLLVLILLFAVGFLRLYHLGYSDYISDEPGTFLYRGDPSIYNYMSVKEFILSQRKGPLQLFVGYIPYFILGNYQNEFAQRLPFSIFSALAIVIFYFFVKRVTKSNFVAFVSSFLLGVNGVVSAYGRIAQYQNLNLFFSFAALYFYSFLLDSDSLKYSLLGTICFSLSFLAHWDAVYVLFPVLYIFILFLRNSSYDSKTKVTIVLANLALGCLLVLPYLIPYLTYLWGSSRNVDYASGILGFGDAFKNRKDLFYFFLHNPFLALPLYVAGIITGILISWKRPLFTLWLGGVFLAFRFFVKYSGLHFYNMFPPICVLVAFSLWKLAHVKFARIPIYIFTFLALAFLYYQSYLLFIDSKIEYPLEREKVVFWETQKYTHEDEIRHKTGFPHKRYWSEINTFINEQNALNNESLGYFTNEYKEISKIYMDADYRNTNGFYAIGIKRPLSFAFDYKFPQIKGKHTVYTIEDEYGDTVVRIYRVESP